MLDSLTVAATRICKKCAVERNIYEFSVRKARKDGIDIVCKTCKSAENAAYRADPINRGKNIQNAANWRAAGNKTVRPESYAAEHNAREKARYVNDAEYRDRQRVYKAKRRRENPEYYARKNREYQLARAFEIRAYNRNYMKTRKENDPAYHARCLDSQTMWRLRHWHEIQEKTGWVKYVPGERIALGEFRALHGWQQGHCYFCNRIMESDGLHRTIEHIVCRSFGGPDLTQNLVFSCSNCNYSRQDKVYDYEWLPESEVHPVHNKFFLHQGTVGKKLTAAGLDWYTDAAGHWVLRGLDGRERALFILSTFFCSDRNPASFGGRVSKIMPKGYDNPLILLDREWFGRSESCLNMLRSKMGIAIRGPGARKLQVTDITQEEANTFLDTHHVMGKKDKVAIRLGLIDLDGTLYAVALFSDKEDVYEWDRLAFRGHIPGGMSKLQNALWELHGYKPIRTFVDSRYADGSGHETIGFQHIGKSPETYLWVFPDKLRHQRYLSNDNKLSTNLLYYNKDLTNSENIRANGIFKIWMPKKHIILTEREEAA
jgi:ribosomal protein L37E